MQKPHIDVSKIKLNETGRTVLNEEQLSRAEASSKAGADWLDDILGDLEEWWDTNHGSCSNILFCGDETNELDCTNHFDCSNSTNESSCLNKGCPDTDNPNTCKNTADCS